MNTPASPTTTDGRCSPDCTCCCKHRHKPRPAGKHCVKCARGHSTPARIEHARRGVPSPEQITLTLVRGEVRKRSHWTFEVRDGFVLVIDLGTGMSVTNDAEAVILALAQLVPDFATKRVLYRDTEGTWDEIAHADGEFECFRYIGTQTPEEAMARLLRRRE